MSTNTMPSSADKPRNSRPYALRLLGMVLLLGSVGLVSCQALLAL